jgi:peroxiredoxin
MALTFSNMLELGTKMPEFQLTNIIDQSLFSSSQLNKKDGSLIMFICNHCPFVIHYHDKIIELSKRYQEQINFIAISSNDITTYPEDAPDEMKKLWQKLNLNFPYLFDSTQALAKAFKAACTPEFYLFNKDNHLVYRGRLDDSTPSNQKPITGADLENAITNLIDGYDIDKKQLPSQGCNIKWKQLTKSL